MLNKNQSLTDACRDLARTATGISMLEKSSAALNTISSIAFFCEHETTEYGDDPEKEKIYLDAKLAAYMHVQEMCNAQSIEDWLNEAPESERNTAGALAQLKELAKGLEVVETALKAASSGDLAQAPFPLVGEQARIHLEATQTAYQEALGFKAFAALREYLKTQALDEPEPSEEAVPQGNVLDDVYICAKIEP